MKPPVYVSLQYARGIAALAVVYFHAVLASTNSFAGLNTPLPKVGAFGVDLFFVLSGFVMWSSTVGRQISPLEFFRRRIIRIVPLYWIMTTLLFAMTCVMPRAAETTVVETSHVLASYLFVPWPNPGMAGRQINDLVTPLLVPGWTLNFEMFFYLLFGLSLMVGVRWRLRALLIGLPLLMTACMVLSPYSLAFEFYGSVRLLEFAGGVVLARATMAAHRPAPVLLAVVAVLVASVALPAVENLRSSMQIVWLGLLSLVVLWGLLDLDRRGRMPENRLLRVLGDASFSIYLTHIFVIAALRTLVLRLMPVDLLRGDATAEAGFVIAAIIFAAMAGIVVHHVFERPVTQFLVRRRRGSDDAVAVAVAER